MSEPPFTAQEVADRWRVCEGCRVEFLVRDSRQRFCRKGCAVRHRVRPVGLRFWSHVNKDGPNGCWLWTGALNHGGYGHTGAIGGTTLAHRVSWYLTFGYLLDLELDHLCRVPACVNPDHLEPVTPLVNRERVVPTTRRVSRCKNGHEFTPENTREYVNASGLHRACKTCNRLAVARYKARA